MDASYCTSFQDRKSFSIRHKKSLKTDRNESLIFEKRTNFPKMFEQLEKRKEESFHNSFNAPNIFPSLLNQNLIKKTKQILFKSQNIDKKLKNGQSLEKLQNKNLENVFSFLISSKKDLLFEDINKFYPIESLWVNFETDKRKEIQLFSSKILSFEELVINLKSVFETAERDSFLSSNINIKLINTLKCTLLEFIKILKCDNYEKGYFLDAIMRIFFYFLDTHIQKIIIGFQAENSHSHLLLSEEKEKVYQLYEDLDKMTEKMDKQNKTNKDIQKYTDEILKKLKNEVIEYHTFYNQLKSQLSALTVVEKVHQEIIIGIERVKMLTKVNPHPHPDVPIEIDKMESHIKKITNILMENDILKDLKQLRTSFKK